MQFLNETPFAAYNTVELNQKAREVLSLTVKATFSILQNRDLVIAPVQRDIEFSDVYTGEPGSSSVHYEADVTIGKQTTDIILTGHAFPQKIGDRETFVMLSVGDIQHTVKVFGDRYWDSIFGITKKSSPEPFEKIPLVYERAFGGVDDSHPDHKYHESEERNPVGTGFRAKHSRLAVKGLKLPNIENPKQLIASPKDRPEPVGFGFIAKNWLNRRKYAGTYDGKWMESRMPLLPLDFDPRFYSAASMGLKTKSYVKGGETILVRNAHAYGPITITVPIINLKVSFLVDAKPVEFGMHIDTVVIDADEDELVLVWHGISDIHGQVDRLKWVHANVVI